MEATICDALRPAIDDLRLLELCPTPKSFTISSMTSSLSFRDSQLFTPVWMNKNCQRDSSCSFTQSAAARVNLSEAHGTRLQMPSSDETSGTNEWSIFSSDRGFAGFIVLVETRLGRFEKIEINGMLGFLFPCSCLPSSNENCSL